MLASSNPLGKGFISFEMLHIMLIDPNDRLDSMQRTWSGLQMALTCGVYRVSSCQYHASASLYTCHCGLRMTVAWNGRRAWHPGAGKKIKH